MSGLVLGDSEAHSVSYVTRKRMKAGRLGKAATTGIVPHLSTLRFQIKLARTVHEWSGFRGFRGA